MLRERFARRYNRTLFGMFPRSRRGESSRRGEGVGSSMDRSGGIITRRSSGSKPVETDGAPLVDKEDLKAMIRLLRVVQVTIWYFGYLVYVLGGSKSDPTCQSNPNLAGWVEIFNHLS